MNNHTTEDMSVLRALRSLTPHRVTSFAESLRVAEIQASRFLRQLEITEYPVPSEAVAGLPRIRVQYIDQLPSSGLSFWNGQEWVIQIRQDQPLVRKRFTLFHEYKHIIDHPVRQQLYTGDDRNSARIQAELAADYFAGCVLIPRPALKAAWGQGIQTSDELARTFAVSRPAIEVRLSQTGLRRQDRCATPSRGSWRIHDVELPTYATRRTG